MPSLTGGPLREDYEFSQVQFRWGPNDAFGAEHSIDGAWYVVTEKLYFLSSDSKDRIIAIVSWILRGNLAI